MSTEDKIAAIRREVEERRWEWVPDTNGARDMLAHHASEGVVIYGVPLSEDESLILRGLVHAAIAEKVPSFAPERVAAIWEMLERGKK